MAPKTLQPIRFFLRMFKKGRKPNFTFQYVIILQINSGKIALIHYDCTCELVIAFTLLCFALMTIGHFWCRMAFSIVDYFVAKQLYSAGFKIIKLNYSHIEVETSTVTFIEFSILFLFYQQIFLTSGKKVAAHIQRRRPHAVSLWQSFSMPWKYDIVILI